MNPIIFEDENGIGVSVGDEKDYITDDIADKLGYEFSSVNQQLTNAKLTIAELNQKMEPLRSKLAIAEAKLDMIEGLFREY